ncbi:MAG: hypothetical protein BWY21_02079 [Parcubacteria group bacterium ADurb.Bin216]|nr:MAG: hypothetical protein BWY21_02079 [Parcubacteria group bacterium ADurb.Bin216]
MEAVRIEEYTIKELEEAVRMVGFDVPRRGKMGDRLYRTVLQSKLARNTNTISVSQMNGIYNRSSSTKKYAKGYKATMSAIDRDVRLRVEHK